MKASPVEHKNLLEVQQLDLQIGRLQHQVSTHPQLQKLEVLKGRQADLRLAIAAAEADVADLKRRITVVEDEITKVQNRQDLQQARLNDGKVPLRDMSAMEHEIARMKIRVEDLENQQIELIDRSENLERGIADTRRTAEAVAKDEEETRAELDADVTAAEEQLNELRSKRAELLEEVNAALRSEYDRAQKVLGTQVVIEVRDGYPLGAPVELPAMELAHVEGMPADQIYISDETEYLVVRTSSN